MINAAMTIENTKNGLQKSHVRNGKTKAALIEPTLTLLVINTSTNPIIKTASAILQSTANITPMLGATPLPALNLWYAEYTCPKTTLTAAK